MFIVTNRKLLPNARGLKKFGPSPNPEGSNELRMVEATPTRAGGWSVRVLPDDLTRDNEGQALMAEVGIEPETDEQGKPRPVYASRYVARKVLERVNPGGGAARRKGRNLAFFVHGYNNDMKAVLDRARGFADNFNVEVVAFSWPAHGGGARGALSYRNDKQHARASIGAFDRAMGRMLEYLDAFNRERVERIMAEAETRFGDNAEARDQYVTRMVARGCPFTVNMVLHSMGNYLYKQVLKSSASEGTGTLFDNVVMVAADTNNADHAEWVDRIRCRAHVYITINERDSALMLSRAKVGESQRARLGHHPFSLHSEQAIYVNFTGAGRVGDSHAYFEGRPLRNTAVKRFFRGAFNGEAAHDGLYYQVSTGMHTFRRGERISPYAVG